MDATDVQRVGCKFFARDSVAVQTAELIPVFQRWIQTQAVAGLLIDVADYGHVYHGPGVMLVGHDGNYALDLAGGRMGLLYSRKQPVDGSLRQRLTAICRLALEACALLEAAPELQGRLRFHGDELELVANDRLLAPNTEATLAALQPSVAALAAQLFDGETSALQRVGLDPRERLVLRAKVGRPLEIATVLQRLTP